MANRTDPSASNIHGTNPQMLIEKIVRSRIYASPYWKEFCFGLTAETLVDRAVELDYFGGTYGGFRKPTKFLCLLLKCLQLQPEREVVLELVRNEDYKYVRVLGAFYLRLVGSAVEVYRYLEPLLNDFRKLRERSQEGRFSVTNVDAVVWRLLREDVLCDVTLPRLAQRMHLEDQRLLAPRRSALEEELDEEEDEKEKGREAGKETEKTADRKRRRRSRSPS